MKCWRFDGFGKLKWIQLPPSLVAWCHKSKWHHVLFSLVDPDQWKAEHWKKTTRAHVLQEGKRESQRVAAFDQAEFKTLPTLSVWFVVFFEFSNTLRWKSSSRAQRWSTYWWPVALLAVLARELFLAALERCWRAVVCTLLPSKSTPT